MADLPFHPQPKMECLRLTKDGYRKLRKLVDERDGERCILCGSHNGIHHHHVIFRSAMGQDREDNLVCLCWRCHDIYAHWKKEKSYRAMFLDYLQSEKCKEWRALNADRINKVYKERRK